jgi:endonuclease/exonuclease/phosphatase family metal-dependent hydrolase
MTETLRIASFNLENLDDRPDLDPPLAARIEVLRPQLLRLDADVLCLQEVHGQKPKGARHRRLLALDRLLAGTPYADYARAFTRSSGEHPDAAWPADIHNLVILSRHPISRSQELRGELVEPPAWRSRTAEPAMAAAEPCRWDRPLLHAAITLPDGRLLHVLNLHLRAPLAASIPGQKLGPFAWASVAGWAEGFFLATVKRAGQALEARLLVERLLDEQPEALIAVVGDLNAEEREMPVRILLAETADTGNGALAPRSLVALERSLPADQRWSVVHQGRRMMLDHVLVSRPLLAAFRHLEIHAETLGDELVAATGLLHPTESTHAPLVAEFALGPGADD